MSNLLDELEKEYQHQYNASRLNHFQVRHHAFFIPVVTSNLNGARRMSSTSSMLSETFFSLASSTHPFAIVGEQTKNLFSVFVFWGGLETVTGEHHSTNPRPQSLEIPNVTSWSWLFFVSSITRASLEKRTERRDRQRYVSSPAVRAHLTGVRVRNYRQ